MAASHDAEVVRAALRLLGEAGRHGAADAKVVEPGTGGSCRVFFSRYVSREGPDWADPHNAPACSAASPPDRDGPARSSNSGIPWPSQLELGRLKGLPSLPEESAIGSDEERRKTTDETKEEDEDNRSLPSEGDRLRGASREYPPRFRRSVAEAGAGGLPEQG
ncbi:hypothetical protein NDU88_004718 [Pleurodeles waltl]|uniref:Uncharacterized protein n=1 Tax=Pleurodeles waltl TaxID=8319 RepID=A0AAV7L279_PLEWA|nr:hypothetical protein NDU88_004718 [Pleurodeles waltl]